MHFYKAALKLRSSCHVKAQCIYQMELGGMDFQKHLMEWLPDEVLDNLDVMSHTSPRNPEERRIYVPITCL